MILSKQENNAFCSKLQNLNKKKLAPKTISSLPKASKAPAAGLKNSFWPPEVIVFWVPQRLCQRLPWYPLVILVTPREACETTNILWRLISLVFVADQKYETFKNDWLLGWLWFMKFIPLTIFRMKRRHQFLQKVRPTWGDAWEASSERNDPSQHSTSANVKRSR